MGTSHSAEEWFVKLGALGLGLGRANRKCVAVAAQIYKNTALARSRAATGGKGKLSHWGWRSKSKDYRTIKLGAGYELLGYDNAMAILRARPQGPWKVVEYGAQPHAIVAGAKRSTRAANREALANETGPVDAYTLAANRRGKNKRRMLHFKKGGTWVVTPAVNHPGTTGKFPWTEAAEAASPVAKAAAAAVFSTEIAKHFGP